MCAHPVPLLKKLSIGFFFLVGGRLVVMLSTWPAWSCEAVHDGCPCHDIRDLCVSVLGRILLQYLKPFTLFYFSKNLLLLKHCKAFLHSVTWSWDKNPNLSVLVALHCTSIFTVKFNYKWMCSETLWSGKCGIFFDLHGRRHCESI